MMQKLSRLIRYFCDPAHAGTHLTSIKFQIPRNANAPFKFSDRASASNHSPRAVVSFPGR